MKILRNPLFIGALVMGGALVGFELRRTWSELNTSEAGLVGQYRPSRKGEVTISAANGNQGPLGVVPLHGSEYAHASALIASEGPQQLVSVSEGDTLHSNSATQLNSHSSGYVADTLSPVTTNSSTSMKPSQAAIYQPAQSGLSPTDDGTAPVIPGGGFVTAAAATGKQEVATPSSKSVSAGSSAQAGSAALMTPSSGSSSAGSASSSDVVRSATAAVNSQSSYSFSPSSPRESSPNSAYIEAYNAYKAQYGAQAAMQQQLGQPVQ